MFTWVADQKIWKRRQCGFKLGRIRYVHPTAGDTFFLRMLLSVVRGAKCYEDVRTYQSVLYPTFRDACQARGLIRDDIEWSTLFDEAILWATSWQLRNLFMMVLIFCEVGNVRGLFDAYWRYMADDIAYRLRPAYGGLSSYVPDTVLLNGLMQELAQLFSYNGLSVASFDLPLLPASSQTPNRLIMEELSHDQQDLFVQSTALCSQLNEDQRYVYDDVLHVVCSGGQFTGFVSGHGGTGKTFLWRAIMATLRSRGHIVLAVASSGVASLLLPGVAPRTLGSGSLLTYMKRVGARSQEAQTWLPLLPYAGAVLSSLLRCGMAHRLDESALKMSLLKNCQKSMTHTPYT
jgi:hypothetical protein